MHILTGDDAHQRLCESTKMAISLERSCKLHVPNALIQRNTPASPSAVLLVFILGERWPLMYSSMPCVHKLFLFCCCRRPRRGFPNWAKWSRGKSWAVGKQRRAAAQTATMKMGVKHREMARAKTVSGTKSVHMQFYSAFFLTLSASSGQIYSIYFLFVHITKCRCL